MIVLGSTGSIGVLALQIANEFSCDVEALAAGRNITLLNRQIHAHRPKLVAIADGRDIGRLEPLGARVFVGEGGICEMLEIARSSLVVNAIVGFAGLKSSIHTQYCKKTLALANKESLVSGGWLLDTQAIVPIDSEHFGLWYLRSKRKIKRLVITASGGAFRDIPIHTIQHQTKSSALKHPNWQMGQKITIDSASMMNKIFEILEAYWLFGYKAIDAFIERSSSVHALIEFVDGSTTAHFALPDMRLPIAYAIDPTQAATHSIIPSMDLSQIVAIRFDAIDLNRYPLYRLKDTLLENPKLGVVVNASNEQAIMHFLQDRITFGALSEIVLESLSVFATKAQALESYDAIASLDTEVRVWCDELIQRCAFQDHNPP